MKNQIQKLKTIDLFAGCGGLIEGFEQTNFFETVAGVEWDQSSFMTLANRLAQKGYNDKQVLRFDIQRTNELLKGWKDDPEYGSGIGLNNVVAQSGGKVDLIIGGPPCQAYSLAGRIRDKDGMTNDYRNYLFEKYIEVVQNFKPKVIVFENVPGILSAMPGGIPIIDRIKNMFSVSGYELIDDIRKYALVEAADYGVPQFRKRVILVGIRKELAKNNPQKLLEHFYTKLLPKFKSSKRVTVGEAILSLPKFKVSNKPAKSMSHIKYPGQKDVQNHLPRFHSKRDIEIFRELAEDVHSGSMKYASVENLKELYTLKTGKVSKIHKYHVLHADKPSNTIVSHLHKDGLRHIHPDFQQARSITPREAARLQSFDDDFLFLGSKGDQYKMIGNAVPPKLAFSIGKAVYELTSQMKSIGA